MTQLFQLCVWFTVILPLTVAYHEAVELDEENYEKVMARFPESVLKFHAAFTYGPEESVFVGAARRLRHIEDILFVEIFVKTMFSTYNKKIADQFGVVTKDFPAIVYVKRDVNVTHKFPKFQNFTTGNFITFINEMTSLNLDRAGCFKSFDKLAKKFMDAPKNRTLILQRAEEYAWKKLTKQKFYYAGIYTKIMRTLLQKGDEILDEEPQHLLKLLKNEKSAKIRTELKHKFNIYKSFKDNALQWPEVEDYQTRVEKERAIRNEKKKKDAEIKTDESNKKKDHKMKTDDIVKTDDEMEKVETDKSVKKGAGKKSETKVKTETKLKSKNKTEESDEKRNEL